MLPMVILAKGAGLGVLTFPDAKPARGWNRGTGRRAGDIDDWAVDLLLVWTVSDSGIVYPKCVVIGAGWEPGDK
jgi:hypothetical protein